MATYLKEKGSEGFARWIEVQAMESSPWMKFYGYVGERGAEVHLHPLRGPLTTKPSVASVFDHALRHERHVTERRRRLIDQGRGARSDDEGSDGPFGKFNPPVELNPEGVSSGAFQRGYRFDSLLGYPERR